MDLGEHTETLTLQGNGIVTAQVGWRVLPDGDERAVAAPYALARAEAPRDVHSVVWLQPGQPEPE